MVKPTLDIENSLWSKGYNFIVGIDEVGRGSWAGPLVVAGVILPKDFIIPDGLADSKLVKPQTRAKLSKIINQSAVRISIAQIEPKAIDKVGVGRATHIAFRKVAANLKPDFCLIDAFYIKHFTRLRQQAVKNGDQICASIAAASIVAKVYRDKLMRSISPKYPAYGFAKHKGYGTKMHQDAIKKYGFSTIHRRSYDLDFLSQG
ncbi:ribonuclease HII [Candidatus Curtissbacteria bacterium]|nr:ribonuclease HII [Candidatus Curtissbacteria bacterium]